MFGKVAALAFLAGLSAAIHTPVGEPNGNPIFTPGLNEIVPAGEAYEITWDPTTPNTVSLQLLKGPSTNAVPFEVIVEGIANSGSYVWTPSTSLEGTPDGFGYGIQLIDDVTGQYQYSTQFGIKNDKVVSSSSATGGHGGYPTGSAVPTSESVKPPTYNTTIVYPTSVGTTSHYVAPTGHPISNSSIIQPTGSLTVPTSLRTTATPVAPPASATTSEAPAGTGAASPLRAGLGLAGAMAAAIMVL